ncbi:MAG: hypothetical protein L0Z50_08545, partial [Verrucomicrobiales bacterium]|nr:hypothetical protein [Verrucomicrobiales bacterium]
FGYGWRHYPRREPFIPIDQTPARHTSAVLLAAAGSTHPKRHEPDRDRSPVAAARNGSQRLRSGRSGFALQESNGFPDTRCRRTCCGRGPSAVRFNGERFV